MTAGPEGEEGGFRSGFVSLVGRPNVGKSTLVNVMVGGKVAIVTDKPQTTRNAIRGVLTLEDAQVVLVDTPGLHKPRNLLGEHLNSVVRRTLGEMDVAVGLFDASQEIGRGDAFLADEVLKTSTPAIGVLTKADLVSPDVLLSRMEAVGSLGGWHSVLTTSAVRGTGILDLVHEIAGLLPEGPLYYPEGVVTDQPESMVAGEIVREKVLELTRQEVPHAVAVVVDEMAPREGKELVDIHASIYVVRESQKGIVIGRGGKVLKEIGIRARAEIEALLGSKVFLDLRVKVEPRWQRDEDLLARMGY